METLPENTGHELEGGGNPQTNFGIIPLKERLGGMKSFEQLYNEIAPGLTNYLVGSGSTYATACDIVQETFVRLWKRRDELMDDDAQIRGLVYTIARNYRIDLARKTGREVLQEEITDATVRSDREIASPLSAPRPGEAEDENAALRRRLLAALAELPPTLREAFTLFQIARLSIREIARQTNVTESNVKVRIHRAKMQLRERLKS